jgi:hypothetical protein
MNILLIIIEKEELGLQQSKEKDHLVADDNFQTINKVSSS